ncbi:protein ITPRID1 isoform X2 [Amia ocellicauda]|uniref:protein ITPRID1 isoform X2 n=1 Tax=Amia ocellicauda TaxID=2972642 RepID=UPI003464C6E5
MMCTGCNLDKRANLTSSKELWPEMDEQQPPQTLSNNKPGDDKQDSIRQWLISSCTLDAKQDTVQCTEQAGSLKRLASAEDDLFLGVEASLYGKNTNYKTVHEYLRSLKPSLGRPVLSRWNSVTSAFSANSGIVSIMDVLDFRHDDPEELLLDLGFGTEEPDIAIKIPARFINYQSKARGINIQIFLQAQKMRMDIENPDFTNRFRELEVLQQVTSAFSSLFNNLSGDKQQQVPVSKKADAGEMNTPAVQEKRRKLGMLFRRASKKTLSLAKSMQEPPSALQIPGTESSADPLQDRRTLFKCSRPCLPENACLSPLAEEQSPAGEKSSVYFPDDDFSPAPMSSECPPLLQDRGEPHQQTSEVLLRQRAAKEPRCVTGSSMRRRSAGDRQTPESFEMEEIQSFDEGSITGPGMEEKIEGFAIRTNSCQSDSSGFLEEPSVPSRLQQASPATEVLKALNTIYGDSIDSLSTLKGSKDLSNTECNQEAEPSQTTHFSYGDETSTHSNLGFQQENKRSNENQNTATGENKSYDIKECFKTEGVQTLGNPGQSVDVYGLHLNDNTGHLNMEEENGKTEQELKDGLETHTSTLDNWIATSELETTSTWNLNENVTHKECTVQINKQDMSTWLNSTTRDDSLQFKDTTEKTISNKEKDFILSSANGSCCSTDALEVEHDSSEAVSSCKSTQKISAKTIFFDQTLSESSSSFVCQQTSFDIGKINKIKGSNELLKSRFRSARSVTVQMPSNLGSFSQNTIKQRSPSKGLSLESVPKTAQQDFFLEKAGSDVSSFHCTDPEDNFEQSTPINTRPKQASSALFLLHGNQSSRLRKRSISLESGLMQDDRQYEETSDSRCCKHHCSCCSSHSLFSPSECHVVKTLELLQCVVSKVSAFPYAMDELEGMIRSLRQFRETLTDIEEQLANEQASVYNILSDNEKEEVRYIQDLRNAVKEEVNELELQLADLAHNSDDGFKMMNRLMDEQSFLHLHLKTQHSGLSSQSNLITKSTRSVSTQCSLLPEIQFPDMLHLHEAARAPDFPQCTGDRARHPAGNINTTKDDININTTESSVKAFVKHEKVDFSTFLQNLKDSLQQSFNSDSLK